MSGSEWYSLKRAHLLEHPCSSLVGTVVVASSVSPLSSLVGTVVVASSVSSLSSFVGTAVGVSSGRGRTAGRGRTVAGRTAFSVPPLVLRLWRVRCGGVRLEGA